MKQAVATSDRTEKREMPLIEFRFSVFVLDGCKLAPKDLDQEVTATAGRVKHFDFLYATEEFPEFVFVVVGFVKRFV